MPYLPEIPGLGGLVEIGRGGNGVVYRARQESLGRDVAVKVLAAHLDDQAAQRFAREGQTLGRVSGHPSIVPIHQAGTTAVGEPFLVMMLCERGSLVEVIQRRGALALPTVLDLGVRMAGALQTAHDAGILHRDLKPGNILLDGYDAPRLADFGQARQVDRQLTRTGDLVATPGYAAPEILTGSPATPQSDVYSLAATLMAALLGHGPFSRDTDESVGAVLLRVVQDPPPDLRRRGVPDRVARLLEQAMAKDPAYRPRTAGDLGRELQGAQAALGLPVTSLVVAGAPPTALLPPVTQGHLLTGAPGPERTAAYDGADQPTTAVTPPADQAPVSAGRRPIRWRWVAVGVAGLLVVAAVAVGIRLLNAPEPRNVSDPADLILSGSDLPGSWRASDQDYDLLTALVGELPNADSDPPAKADPSTLATCLGLPLGQVSSSSASAMYFDTERTSSPPTSNLEYRPSSYQLERSVGMVMASESAAQAMVDPWHGAKFDTCVKDAEGGGAAIGGESDIVGAAVGADEPYDLSVPNRVDLVVREIRVPLSAKAGSSDGPVVASDPPKVDERIMTLVAAASGTAVLYVVLYTNGQPPTADDMGTIIDNVVDKLTD